jgi:L-malate glycosyltransferase
MLSREPIIFVIDQFASPYAGTESQLLKLLENLPAVGFEPRLLVLRCSDFIKENAMPCPVDVLGHHRLASPRTWWELFRYGRSLRLRGFRLAHVFFNDASLICPPVFRACGLKTIISRRDLGYWYTPLLVGLLRITRRFTAGVVVNSAAVGEITANTEGYESGRICVIYNGYYASRNGTFEAVTELEELATMGPLALLVANVRPIKRIADAVTAVAMMKDRGSNLTLAVIGGGDAEPLRQQAEALGVGDRVSFLGSRSDVRNCVSYGVVGLSCSESEGYSNAVVEYMQAGLPVVASDVGGNQEAVNHGVTGWRYPAGNVRELSDYLEGLLADPEHARQMGYAGKQLAQQRHDLKTMIDSHVQFYQEVLGDKESVPI